MDALIVDFLNRYTVQYIAQIHILHTYYGVYMYVLMNILNEQSIKLLRASVINVCMSESE